MSNNNSGFYMNSLLYNDNSIAPGIMSICKTNKKRPYTYEPPGTNRRFVFKVAIHSIGVSSSIKSKVVHFKQKNNGSWKRARAKLAVSISGPIYSTVCNYIDTRSKTDPFTGGTYKKRNELRVRSSACCTIWKTNNGEVIGILATPEGYGGSLPLTW